GGGRIIKQKLRGACVGAHLQPPGRARRVQEHARRGMSPAAMNGTLEIADARLVIAAVVVCTTRNAGADRACDERLANRMDPVDVRHGEVSLTPVDAVVGDADAAFGALEIGQDVHVAPATVAALRPVVEIRALPAIVDHAVDRAGAAQRAALRGGDLSAAGT